MELLDIGEHCSEATCRQLDFLPMKCDACEDVFCKDHITYRQHKCSSAYKKDVQVPVCPLCSAPVPVKRGELADIAVGQHIDRNCSSKRKQKIFTNRCCKSGCRRKELMKLECDQCHSNFCLSHRHPLDHDCKCKGQALSKAGSAALLRSQKTAEPNRAAILPPKQQEVKQSGCCRAVHERGHNVSDRFYRTSLHIIRSNMCFSKCLLSSNHPAAPGEAFICDLHNGLSEEEALQRALELSLLEVGINNLLTLRNPAINTIKSGSQ